MSAADLEDRFTDEIHRHRLLADDDAAVVGVSGGLDSVVMLHLLDAWARAGGSESIPSRRVALPRLHVAHLNHRLRGPEADADAAFVRELANGMGWPCTVESIDVAAFARERQMSIEQAGRECRFAFFERVCETHGIQAIALGHHAGDNAETILHRIIRGTGIRGLGGIRRQRLLRAPASSREQPDQRPIRLIRPMLGFSRQEIEQYARERQITFQEDASNRTVAFTRNRIRHEVLPLLRTFNPRAEAALLRLGQQAAALDAFWRRAGRRLLRDVLQEEEPGRLVLDITRLARHPQAIQAQLVHDALLRLGVPEARLSSAHLEAVVDLATSQAGSSERHLPGVMAMRQYSRLVLERRAAYGDRTVPGEPAGETIVAVEGATPLPAFGLELRAEVLPADPAAIAAYLQRAASGKRDANEEWLDADRVALPLTARSPRPGDRFMPLGMKGEKKLSDFFVDEKIDAAGRSKVPILCDARGPIWVVQRRIDDRVQLRDDTRRILRLRVCRTPSAS